MTSSFFFKMLLLWQFLSELDDIRTQCSPIWFVYMVLTDNRSGSYDVTDDVITYNHCRNFGARKRGQIAGWFQRTSNMNLRMGYRLRMVAMTSRDRMTS